MSIDGFAQTDRTYEQTLMHVPKDVWVSNPRCRIQEENLRAFISWPGLPRVLRGVLTPWVP